MSSEGNSGDAAVCGTFMESCLRNKNDFVNIEAARAICASPSVTSRELSAAVNSLQLFLTSQKTVLVFAAVRTLSQVRSGYPSYLKSSTVFPFLCHLLNVINYPRWLLSILKQLRHAIMRWSS